MSRWRIKAQFNLSLSSFEKEEKSKFRFYSFSIVWRSILAEKSEQPRLNQALHAHVRTRTHGSTKKNRQATLLFCTSTEFLIFRSSSTHLLLPYHPHSCCLRLVASPSYLLPLQA